MKTLQFARPRMFEDGQGSKLGNVERRCLECRSKPGNNKHLCTEVSILSTNSGISLAQIGIKCPKPGLKLINVGSTWRSRDMFLFVQDKSPSPGWLVTL